MVLITRRRGVWDLKGCSSSLSDPPPYPSSASSTNMGINPCDSPTWPNNCPWVTNVGATKVYPGKTVFEPESAVYDPAGHPYSVNYSSGGGFSNIHATPKYQQAAVDTFFKEHNPPYKGYSVLVNDTDQIPALEKKGIYNRIGRGIPDVCSTRP